MPIFEKLRNFAAAALILTGSSFSALAAENRSASPLDNIHVSKNVCADFERDIRAATVGPSPTSQLITQTRILTRVEEEVFRANPELARAYKRATDEVNATSNLSTAEPSTQNFAAIEEMEAMERRAKFAIGDACKDSWGEFQRKLKPRPFDLRQ